MKRKILFMVLFMIIVLTITAQKAQKIELRTAYVYRAESLLISDSDLNCSYFITEGFSEDLHIIGADQMDFLKKDYTDGDTVYINKGYKDGIREGDIFLIVAKGNRTFNQITKKKLGCLYMKKSLGEVICIYEDRAAVKLGKGCNPVNIGDLVIPYKPRERLIGKKPVYSKCRIPQNRVEGNVVYSSLYMDAERKIVGPGEHVTIDQGKATVSFGNFLLFYKILKPELPPLITGVGIIIDTQNTCSTAKVLEAVKPVQVGTKFVVLTKEDLLLDKSKKFKLRRLTGEEEVPILEKLEQKEGEATMDAQTFELNILFDINEKNIKEENKVELEKISEFLQGKSEFIIILRGYACSIGNEEYNLKLSKERVENVKKHLMEAFNVKADFFETYFYGEKDAPYDNTVEEERRKNRLVNIQVIGK